MSTVTLLRSLTLSTEFNNAFDFSREQNCESALLFPNPSENSSRHFDPPLGEGAGLHRHDEAAERWWSDLTHLLLD